MHPISIAVAVFIAILLCYGFIVWSNLNRSIQASKPLIAQAVAYEQHPASSTVRILVAGDSTGVGVGAKNSRDSIAGRLGALFPSADITNISHSGDTVAQLEQKLAGQSGVGYDIVLLQIGANDITGRTPLEEVRASLARVLDTADMLGGKVGVMTAGNVGVTPAFLWPLSSYFTRRTLEVRKIFIDEVAKHPQASYIDLFKERKDDEFSHDVARYYAPDLFHPSGDGYGVWFIKVEELLKT